MVIRCELESLLSDGLLIDGAPYFRYVRGVLAPTRGMTMTLTRSMTIEPEIINKTPCDNNFACLSEKNVCNVEPYEDRDVQILICKDERSCVFRKNYLGWVICTCPVNRAALIRN